jgi:hypothetical protein
MQEEGSKLRNQRPKMPELSRAVGRVKIRWGRLVPALDSESGRTGTQSKGEWEGG